MKIKTKFNKGYKPIENSPRNICLEKYYLILIILIGLLVILFFTHLFLRIYIKNSSKNKYQILSNMKLEPEEINYNNSVPMKDMNELKEIKNYINNDKLINPNEKIQKYENPKISIIMPITNEEINIEKSLLSIYNQNCKEIEIILINDLSTDTISEKINALLSKYPSISLYKTEKEKKGILNSKITGILNSKGKYILFLNQNDFFTKSNAFNILYEEVEKNNLDILGFSSLLNEGKYIHNYNEVQNIRQIMYNVTKEEINRNGDELFNYFIKKDLLIQNIKGIDEKYLKKNISYNPDFFLLFLLSRNATNFKQIKNIFYYSSNNWHKRWEESDLNLRCLNYLYYIDFLYNKTNDDYGDKKIVIYELENWILNTKCRKNDLIRNELTLLCKNLSEKKYVENKYKLELYLYIFENTTVISSL